VFGTTHWSVVLAAGRGGPTSAQNALACLCETYWYPLYAYVRRRGHRPEDAQDLTQEFFRRLLEGNWVGSADPDKGRFRTFLLTAMTRFLANEWDRARAAKRGGSAATVPLDGAEAEGRYLAEPQAGLSADRLYDRQWATTLLQRSLSRLSKEHEHLGKAAEFAALSPFLGADRGSIPYGQVAEHLGLSEVAARQAIHRLRKEFRQVFREEILQTLATPDDVDAEVRYLIAALAE
jgi:RNA polymerase sigma-70 factor (ECF subfamily)